MDETELVVTLIDNYAALQRIITADDPKKEAEYQLNVVSFKLKALGLDTDKIFKDN